MKRNRTSVPGAGLVIGLLGVAIVWAAWLAQSRPVALDLENRHAAVDPQWPDMRVDVNTASAAELSLLPGIGPKLAERILETRISFGPFASVDDLSRVPGIGPQTISRLADSAVATDPESVVFDEETWSAADAR